MGPECPLVATHRGLVEDQIEAFAGLAVFEPDPSADRRHSVMPRQELHDDQERATPRQATDQGDADRRRR